MAIQGQRTVYQAGQENIVQRDVSKDMLLLEPDASPLYVLTNRAGQSKPSITPVFEWVEDAEVPLWDVAAEGADKAAGATTLTVGDATKFVIGDLLVFPKAIASNAVEEVALVTNIAGSILTLTRGIGGSGADTINATGSIRIIGSSFAEGAALPVARSSAKNVVKSACQIFRTPVNITNTMKATETYSEDEENLQLAKALIRHKSEIEAVGLWGRFFDGSGSNPAQWYSKGVKSTIATYVTDINTTMTKQKMMSFSETGFRYGKNSKLLIAAPGVISAINGLALGTTADYGSVRITTDEKLFGVAISRYQTAHGTFVLARNFRMEASPFGTGLNGFEDEAYLIDLDVVRWRFLAGNGENRNTKLRKNVVQDGSDGVKHEYYTQGGWEVRHDKRHARLFRCTSYA